MPRTNVVGTTTPTGSGAQLCAQAGEREHRIDSTAGTDATTAVRILSPPLMPVRAGLSGDRWCWVLRYGHTRTPLALVVPDFDWPDMWRIAWPDGRLSDLVNLPRAKDAAEAISERGPPARNRRLFHWHTSKTPRGAAPVRQTGTALATSLTETPNPERTHG
jgi:hypothetical protein